METMAGTIRSMMDAAIPFEESPKLTQFAHGGGCGCKIAPGLLREILARAPQGLVPPELMVGTETADDAAVYRLNATQALVATTDFFTPIVDDPYDFGRIAATNALSDIYAMGGTPILALALVGMPIAKLAPEVIGRVLEGGASVCREAGIPIAGGHSIDVLEPIYGLVGLGLVHPDRVRRNADAQAGDVLVLQTLLWADEVREANFPSLQEDVTISDKELELSASLVESYSADFDPDSFVDEYQKELRTLIDAKIEAGEGFDASVTFAEEGESATGGEVIDLMEALRASVERSKAAKAKDAG